MMTITKTKQDICRELKEAYGLEYMHFYYIQPTRLHRMYCCKYDVNENLYLEDALDPRNLDFLLKALNMQQGEVYFEDVKKVCVGMDELKMHYLPIKLAGIK